MTEIDKHIEEIKELCSRYRVKSLYAFGSVLTNKFSKNSDIDLLVEFDQIATPLYADNYYGLKFSLEDILHRPVDLLEEKAVKNPYFRENVNRQRQLIYGY
ncbi:MAG: nucleotidyltransferase domain-containing protein [Dinghuibacter sp.]|nr:nucleotidyltransferase domain-containing protein [Dinghuibacter sp.]